jgi:hypothetical protein
MNKQDHSVYINVVINFVHLNVYPLTNINCIRGHIYTPKLIFTLLI